MATPNALTTGVTQLGAWWHAQVSDLHMCWADNYKNTNLVGPLLICQILFGSITSPRHSLLGTHWCAWSNLFIKYLFVLVCLLTGSLNLLMNSPTVLTLVSYICRLTDISVSIVLIYWKAPSVPGVTLGQSTKQSKNCPSEMFEWSLPKTRKGHEVEHWNWLSDL